MLFFYFSNGNMQHVKAMFLQSSANVYVYAAIQLTVGGFDLLGHTLSCMTFIHSHPCVYTVHM